MIDVQNITFRYSSKSEPVFHNFCLQLEQNKVYGLLGENGTGKSTLLYLLMGLLRPEEGIITVDNADVSQRKRATLQQMYIVPEEFDLPQMRFTDYVATYRPFYPAFSDDILHRCMDEFHLPLDARLNQLSMGDKKKALMSFALATNVRYLLMDEPTNGLDLPSKKQFRKVIVGQDGSMPSSSSSSCWHCSFSCWRSWAYCMTLHHAPYATSGAMEFPSSPSSSLTSPTAPSAEHR